MRNITSMLFTRVPHLKHEIWNDTMDFRSLVAQIFARQFGFATVAFGQGHKILDSLGTDFSIQSHNNASQFDTIHFNIKKYTICDYRKSSAERKTSQKS